MPKFLIVLFHIFLSLVLRPSNAQSWVKAGYWYNGSEFPISDINSALFTHLNCAFADLNSTSYELFVSSSNEQYFSNFTATVKQKNPSITTLLSIRGGQADYTAFSLMVSKPSYRKSFVDSSIKIARLYGFQGLDLSWVSANTSSDMTSMGLLFQEWRVAVNSEAKNSSEAGLILTAAVSYTPHVVSTSYPIESIRDNLNWVNVMAYDFYAPGWSNVTGASAALYDPSGQASADKGINEWIAMGLNAGKLVLSLPFYGYAWELKDPNDNAIGAPATGPANATARTSDGAMSYKDIKSHIRGNGTEVRYNATYVVKYCTVGSAWIGFDDAEVVKIKVAYAKQKKLLGYSAWQLPYDDNWELSIAAQEELNKRQHINRRLLVIVLTSTLAFGLLVVLVMCCLWKRPSKLKGILTTSRISKSEVKLKEAVGDFDGSVPDLQVFSLAIIEAATDKLSFENKLGEGGYGPVYKGVLSNGQEIAVKKLSKTSTQGFEEFKTEVVLTAKLQHVNLVRLLGFCIERNEQMLIYEYMPNKSLDFYLFGLTSFLHSFTENAITLKEVLKDCGLVIPFVITLLPKTSKLKRSQDDTGIKLIDPPNQYLLDWNKRIEIIEGITQGLLYLQEYSRMTIIHRDLKASNILLDKDMKPKIADFGMAKTFMKDEHEANTGRIVGTYGYVPPEYVKQGLYSTKSDVYSFGVLLLQIISGKRNRYCYGWNGSLNLLEYAYELWKEGKGMEFMDPSLDDTLSSCKLIRCIQTALLCVQEDANDRPSMLEVSSMLKNETVTLKTPKKPAFSRKTEEEEIKPAMQPDCSVNDATVTELEAR